jgi:TonB family protein
VVNGGKTSEQDSGDYEPSWLNDMVQTIFDPFPRLESYKNAGLKMLKPDGSDLLKLGGSVRSVSCPRIVQKVGTPPAENSVFSNICFEGSHGLFESVITPEFGVQFKDYKSFGDKRVSMRLVSDPEPGTTIEAKITALTEYSGVDEALFEVSELTPPEQQLKSIWIDQATAQSLSVSTPPIVWPSPRDGKTSGVLSMRISVDRNGQVQEAWPLNSDNPQLDDSAREQVKKWRFKPATNHGARVQIESLLTFAFDTKIVDPVTILSDAEARKVAVKIVEPRIPPSSIPRGAALVVRASVGEDGKVSGGQNPNNLPTAQFMSIWGAVREWSFKPRTRDGKPEPFKVDLAFPAP